MSVSFVLLNHVASYSNFRILEKQSTGTSVPFTLVSLEGRAILLLVSQFSLVTV